MPIQFLGSEHQGFPKTFHQSQHSSSNMNYFPHATPFSSPNPHPLLSAFQMSKKPRPGPVYLYLCAEAQVYHLLQFSPNLATHPLDKVRSLDRLFQLKAFHLHRLLYYHDCLPLPVAKKNGIGFPCTSYLRVKYTDGSE
ncbi:hypothetical protein Hanom_Chr11g00996291 [Helianthus anomalus]